MDRTTVHLVVSFTFVSNGSYMIPLKGGKTATVNVAHATSGISATGILGMINHDVQLYPDDPNGFMNVSDITIELPILISPPEPRLTASMFSNTDSRSDIKEIKQYCLACLNRLIEVVRYYTKRYWIRTLREQDLCIYKVITEENGMPHEESFYSPPSGYDYPIKIVDEANVKTKIQEMLQNKIALPLSLKFWFDGLNLYSSGRFNEAVINANIHFEVFLDEYLGDKYKSVGKNDKEIIQLLRKEFKDGVHKLVRRNFFKGQKDEDLKQGKDEMYIKFDSFRNKRTDALHHRVRNITQQEALKVLQDSREVGVWILRGEWQK